MAGTSSLASGRRIPERIDMGKQSGFTLLEIMIALAISGIVVACLFAVYNRTLQSGEQVKEQSGLEQSARMIFLQLDRDLEGLYYRRSSNASSPGPFSFRGGQGAAAARRQRPSGTPIMRFASTTSLDFRETGFPERRLLQVRYLLRDSQPEGEGPKTLLRRQLPFPEISEKSSSLALTDRVKEISVTFHDSSGRERSSWDSVSRIQDQEKPQLPRRVEVELTLQSEEGTQRSYQMDFALSGSGGDE